MRRRVPERRPYRRLGLTGRFMISEAWRVSPCSVISNRPSIRCAANCISANRSRHGPSFSPGGRPTSSACTSRCIAERQHVSRYGSLQSGSGTSFDGVCGMGVAIHRGRALLQGEPGPRSRAFPVYEDNPPRPGETRHRFCGRLVVAPLARRQTGYLQGRRKHRVARFAAPSVGCRPHRHRHLPVLRRRLLPTDLRERQQAYPHRG